MNDASNWIQFTPGSAFPPATDVLELTEEQAHALWRVQFGRMVTVLGELIHFTVPREERDVHYVLMDPSTAAGRGERDGILARYGALLPTRTIDDLEVAL